MNARAKTMLECFDILTRDTQYSKDETRQAFYFYRAGFEIGSHYNMQPEISKEEMEAYLKSKET